MGGEGKAVPISASGTKATSPYIDAAKGGVGTNKILAATAFYPSIWRCGTRLLLLRFLHACFCLFQFPLHLGYGGTTQGRPHSCLSFYAHRTDNAAAFDDSICLRGLLE